MRLDSLDRLTMAALAAFVLLYTWLTFSFSTIPFEDAAILMRFADHMAQGKGIIWNLGEQPVDGATDFLFLVSLGFLGMFGMDIHRAVHLVGIGSHAATVVFVYFAVRKLHKAPRWMAILSALFLTVGPGLRQVEAYFGATYFALFAAICWYLVYEIYRDRDRPRTTIWFALSSLMLGLIRPEGVFLSAFMVAALLFCRGWEKAKRLVVHYVLIFGVLGAIYFFWRWSYFGYPLPNPFYVKGGGSLYPFSLIDSCKNVINLSLPFLPILVYSWAIAAGRVLRSAERRKYLMLFAGIGVVAWGCALFMGLVDETGGKPDPARGAGIKWCLMIGAAFLFGPPLVAALFPTEREDDQDRVPVREAQEPIFVLIPVFAFTFLWILMSAIMNYLERFQYAVLPIVLISWPPLLISILRTWWLPPAYLPEARYRALRSMLLILVFGGALGYYVDRYQSVVVHHDGTYDTAKILADYGGSERKIIVTNAGHLPYYSGWTAVDAWGLTDQKIAHEGLTEEYVREINPDVIQFDGFFSPVVDSHRPEFDGWEWYEATLLLKRYAEENGYVLAAAWGVDPYKSHHYYVRKDAADAAEIIERIRLTNYTFFGKQRCFNYAMP